MNRSELHMDSFLPSLIRNLSEGMAASMSQQISGRFRLNWTEWRILLQLAEHNELTASDVVEYSAMEKSKVSRAIASLEARDLIVRKVSEKDHRVKLLAITETGLKRYQAIVPRVLDWEKDLMEGLDASEYRDLLYLLEKLKKQLKAMPGEHDAEVVTRGER